MWIPILVRQTTYSFFFYTSKHLGLYILVCTVCWCNLIFEWLAKIKAGIEGLTVYRGDIVDFVCTVTPGGTVGISWQPHMFMHECIEHGSTHVFLMEQTGRTIMVSGRNGVRFPKRSCCAVVCDGFRSRSENVYGTIYTWLSQRESVLRFGCFHRDVDGRSWTHPKLRTEGRLWSGHRGLDGPGVCSVECSPLSQSMTGGRETAVMLETFVLQGNTHTHTHTHEC